MTLSEMKEKLVIRHGTLHNAAHQLGVAYWMLLRVLKKNSVNHNVCKKLANEFGLTIEQVKYAKTGE